MTATLDRTPFVHARLVAMRRDGFHLQLGAELEASRLAIELPADAVAFLMALSRRPKPLATILRHAKLRDRPGHVQPLMASSRSGLTISPLGVVVKKLLGCR